MKVMRNIKNIIINIYKVVIELVRNIKKWFNNDSSNKNYLYFITTSDSLPSTLTPAEEEKLLYELESNNSSEARDKLIERNMRLVVYIAKKFESPTQSLEDLVSIGIIGLIKGVSTFKSDKNIKLATYASKCIENEILMHIRKYQKIKQEVSLDVPISGDNDGNELLLSDIIQSDNNEVGENIEKETSKILLLKLLNRLPSREKEIISLRYGLDNEYTKCIDRKKLASIREERKAKPKDKEKIEKRKDSLKTYSEELTQKEVADYLGISQSYISRIEKKIIKVLKKELIRYS